MKEIVITKKGPPSVFEIKERQDPNPPANHVRVRVKASGVNFADILARKGLYPDAPPLPAVVGYEVSGVIDELGENVSSEWKDAAVICFTKFQGYADTVIVPINWCFKKPEHLSFEQAASLPVVYTTAWMLLIVMGGLRKGQTVLIQNAGGAVGLAAIDIARHVGAKIIGTASAKKHEFLMQRGLNFAIDYRTENVTDRVKQITNNKGVDLIIDPIGGAEWKKNYDLLKKSGRLGIFGASILSDSSDSILSKGVNMIKFLAAMPRWSPLTLMGDNRGVFGVNLGHMFDDFEDAAQWFNEILEGTKGDDAWVRPLVDKVFPFDQVAASHEHIEARNNIGKVILTP